MPAPIILFLDWDSTLTTASTVPLLLSLSPTPPSTCPAELSAHYASALAVHSSSYAPSASSRNTLAQEVVYLDSLRGIERASIERCEEAGVWRGVSPQVIDDAAGEAIRGRSVVLREGAERVIQQGLNGRGRVVVLSVGWSAQFIRGCLLAAMGKEAEAVEIKANEIVEDRKLNRYFGAERGGIWTCADKARVLKEVVGKAKAKAKAKEVRTVYVGDSVTDLECVTSVDVGICMRGEVEGTEQKELHGTLKRLAIECRWIVERKAGEQETGVWEDKVVLWWARDFHDICEGEF